MGGQPSYPTITGSYSSGPDIEGMDFTITYPNGNNSEYIGFIGSKIYVPRKIMFPEDTNGYFYYSKQNFCNYLKVYKMKTHKGFVNFTRYDLSTGIFSGTFDFKNWLPDSVRGSCDTVKITNGIFDI